MARKTPQPLPRSFEEALDEIERIAEQLESSETGLEESIARFERGRFLIDHCRGVLASAEKQIELISRQPDGSLASQPAPGDSA